MSSPFGQQHCLGCAFYDEPRRTLWAFATDKGPTGDQPGVVVAHWSQDGMKTWQSRVTSINATALKLKAVWNTSVHKGKKGGFVMAIETSLNGGCCGPIVFATSQDHEYAR